MRLATFIDPAGRSRIGAAVGDQLIDLNAAYAFVLRQRGDARAAEQAYAIVPADMIGLLDGGERSLKAAEEITGTVANLDRGTVAANHLAYAIDSVKLCAPIPRPRKLILVGLNYRDHAAESGQKIPEVPTLFSKYPNSVIAHGEAIKVPKVSSMIDWEGEFAFVIGRAGKDIAKERALDYVAGYTICHDVSCRDYQMRTGQWMVGKTFDTFCPLGPYLVTRDEISDPHNLELSTFVNGERVQHSNTKNLIFNTNDLIAFMSQVFTLEPGDVVSTGTPAGVGAARRPPVWLKAGDRVRIEIAGLGVLENPVEG